MLILPICASPVTCFVSRSTLHHCWNDNPAPIYLMIIENCREFPTEIRYHLELTFSPSSAFSCSLKMLKALTALFKSSSSLSRSIKSLPMIVSTIDLSTGTFKLTLEAFMGWKVVSLEANFFSLLQESTACILQTSIHVALLYAFEYCHFSMVIWSISHLRFFFVFVLHLHSLLDQISHKISTWQKQWHHWMDHEIKLSTHKSLAKAIGSF